MAGSTADSIAVNDSRRGVMSTLTIRQLDDSVKDRLRRRAAAQGISMEEEARRALQSWVAQSGPSKGLATRIRERFAEAGWPELEVPPRDGGHRPLPDIFNDE
jgi:plasmid stability protein